MNALYKKIENHEVIFKEDLQRLKKEMELEEERKWVDRLEIEIRGTIINTAATTMKTSCFTDLMRHMGNKSEEKQKELVESILSRLQQTFPDMLLKHEIQKDVRNGRVINNGIVASWE